MERLVFFVQLFGVPYVDEVLCERFGPLPSTLTKVWGIILYISQIKLIYEQWEAVFQKKDIKAALTSLFLEIEKASNKCGSTSGIKEYNFTFSACRIRMI